MNTIIPIDIYDTSLLVVFGGKDELRRKLQVCQRRGGAWG